MRKTITAKQRRRRGMFIGMAIVLIIIGYVLLTPPSGYALHAPAGSFAPLEWKHLQEGQWNNKSKPVIANEVKRLDGQQVVLHGFLLPLHKPAAASQFFVAGRPRGCYFCNPPGVSEVAQVNVAGGKELPFTDLPVTIYGRLKVATGSPDDEMLYIIDDATLTAGIF